MMVVKDAHGNTLRVSSDDPRYLQGDFVSIHKGRVMVRDIYGKCFKVSIDDPRYLSGELQPNTKGYLVAKDLWGRVFYIRKDDPRYLSGELVHINAHNWNWRKNITIDGEKNNVKHFASKYSVKASKLKDYLITNCINYQE